ncbi:MAG: FAD-dependent monooxygenase, partial [Pseudomonadota bacterium]|nr:FAD-dependent monooxygenase [Pseudomonadota bacterium]
MVGAGPTGLITTNLLGQDGIKTLLVEQHESTVSQPRA